jgi:hypothetical protein
MAAPATSLTDNPGKPYVTEAKTSSPTFFRHPTKMIGTALAIIAGVAGLIANVSSIEEFFEPSLAGTWQLSLTIKASNGNLYTGDTAAYHLYLDANGDSLKGTGEKFQFNGKELPSSQKQPITVLGQLSGNSVILNFKQEPAPDGRARETIGQFTLNLDRPWFLSRQVSDMRGTFSGTAADWRGTVVAVRAN